MNEESATSASGNGRVDWPAVVETHRRWLRTVVYSRLGNSDAVEEVLQEMTLTVLESDPELRDAANAPAWLYRVALRGVLLYRRRHGREQRRTEEYAQRNGAAENGHAYDPLRWLLADEERGLVRRALERLRPRDRELLLLKYTEHWSCGDLAERLGIQTAAVEMRLHRAKKRLRRELARLDIRGDEH